MMAQQTRRPEPAPAPKEPVPLGLRPVAGPDVSSPAPIRIRTGHSYHVYFTIALGQRNARFIERAMTPLNRYMAWADSVSFVPEPGFEAIHTWNAIPRMTRRPYVVTFEDYLPRMPDDRRIEWLERRLVSDLLSPRCRRIIAISEYALRQFRWQHRDLPQLPQLLEKTEIIYPAVAPRTNRPKTRGGPLKLLFVGRDFMRKGGPVLLRAHRKLRRIGVPVETTVVSSLSWSPKDYVGPADPAYVEAAHRELNQDGVIHHHSLPSSAVHELMDAADYLVFPTFHDTFGFVSLEAFASATPVIATNTCVLPEVVQSNRNGFLLPFQNDETVGKWAWLYRQGEAGYLDAYEAATRSLAEALFQRLATTWDDAGLYEQMSAGAVAAAHGRFHPEAARRRLEEVYECFGTRR